MEVCRRSYVLVFTRGSVLGVVVLEPEVVKKLPITNAEVTIPEEIIVIPVELRYVIDSDDKIRRIVIEFE